MEDEFVSEAPIEERRLEAEIGLRQAELALRREELDARLANQKQERRRKVSPLVLALVAAGAGVFGTMAGSLQQIMSDTRMYDLEMRRLQGSMLLQALGEEHLQQAEENVLFLLDMGLLHDPEDRLRDRVEARGQRLRAKPPEILALEDRATDEPDEPGIEY